MGHFLKTSDIGECPTCPVAAIIQQPTDREVSDLGLDEFCAVLEQGDFLAFFERGGLQIIILPRATLINNGGECTIVKARGSNIDAYLHEALTALNRYAA